MSKTTENLIKAQERVRTDPVYLELSQEYNRHNAAFLSVLKELNPGQRQIIEDYLGICVELHTKMLLAACEEPTIR